MTDPVHVGTARSMPAFETSTSTNLEAQTKGTIDSRFVAQMLELQNDRRMIEVDLETYRDMPTSDFVDLDDIPD